MHPKMHRISDHRSSPDIKIYRSSYFFTLEWRISNTTASSCVEDDQLTTVSKSQWLMRFVQTCWSEILHRLIDPTGTLSRSLNSLPDFPVVNHAVDQSETEELEGDSRGRAVNNLNRTRRISLITDTQDGILFYYHDGNVHVDWIMDRKQFKACMTSDFVEFYKELHWSNVTGSSYSLHALEHSLCMTKYNLLFQ
jgi:hypothetical protein